MKRKHCYCVWRKCYDLAVLILQTVIGRHNSGNKSRQLRKLGAGERSRQQVHMSLNIGCGGGGCWR